MAKPTDPNSPPPPGPGNVPAASPSPAEKAYRQAVAAFKAGRYDSALAQFQRLGQLPPGSAYQLKGLMGQVRTYQQLNQVDQVRQVCQQLLGSPAPQAQRWAAQVLSQLPHPPDGIPAGAGPSDSFGSGSPSPDRPSPDRPSPDRSGFVPLAGAPAAASPRRKAPPAPPPLGTATVTPQAAAPDLAAPDPNAPGPEGRSLFHYQQLNRRSGDSVAAPEPGAPEPEIPEPVPAASARPAAPIAPGTPQRALPHRLWGLWIAQGITAIGLLWVVNWAFHTALQRLDGVLGRVRWPVPLGLPGADGSYTLGLVAVLGGLALASPWLLDYLLRAGYGQIPLSTRQLQAHSPAALRLLHQVCRQQGWLLPELRLIPSPAPLCFSYGWLPRHTRIVVSQGLLDQSSDTTLAALYGYELARIVNGSLPMLSAVGLPLVGLHTLYHRLAALGDRLSQPLLRSPIGLAATACYGLFWLLRQGVLWLSRLCSSWADRRGVALTQRPDELAVGLLELSAAIAQHLQHQGLLHPLHVSLDCLMPVSCRQAILPGWGALPTTALATTLVTVDGGNPYRQWLRGNAAHPPLGERLLWLQQQALGRGLRGLEISAPPPATSLSPARLLLQKGPLAGLMAGGSIALGLWFLGGIVNRLGWVRLSWLYQDPSVLAGGLGLGLGLGLLLRINALFPDRPGTGRGRPQLDTVAGAWRSAAQLPVQGQPVTLQGRLLGSPGLANYGCQDLYLADETGAVRLIHPVPLNSLQSPALGVAHPLGWLGRSAVVTGWSRYGGGLFWVDIEQITVGSQPPLKTRGPLWATGLSLAISLWGIAAIVRGG